MLMCALHRLVKRGGNRAEQARQAGIHGLRGLILFEDNFRDTQEVQYPDGPQMPNC